MMSDEVELLPKSYIGVDGPVLVIAPPGSPQIRLDARLLDRISLIGRSSTSAITVASAAALGMVGTAAGIIPGGIILSLVLGGLGLDRALESRRRAASRDLLLVLGSLEVALHVADGPDAATRLVHQLAPYTRTAPIVTAEAYQDASRRLDAHALGRTPEENRRDVERALRFGSELVTIEDGNLRVGSTTFSAAQVRELGVRAGNLVLPGGRQLQAGLALLLIAADKRSTGGEDLSSLAKRLAEYREWSGSGAAR